MIKSTSIPRRWGDAISKVQAENRCRVCGTSQMLEAAHVIGRKHDPIHTGPRGGEYRYVHPDSVVPLCSEHHREYDARKLDLLPFLLWPEQTRAVEDAGGIMGAMKRTCGREGL